MSTIGTTIPPTIQVAIAQELTRLSGVRWRSETGNPEHGHHEFTLTSADHHAIQANTVWNNPLRLKFLPLEPRRPDGVTWEDVAGVTRDWPTITVAKDRYAEHIAKEVYRRLLPRADEAWDRWHERVNDVLERRTIANSTVHWLREVAPQANVRTIGKEHTLSIWRNDGPRIAVVVNEFGQIDVSLTNVPFEFARAILKKVAAFTPPASATP